MNYEHSYLLKHRRLFFKDHWKPCWNIPQQSFACDRKEPSICEATTESSMDTS